MSTTNAPLKDKPIHEQGRLIESIYRTVGEPDTWNGLLRELVAVTNSRSVRLLVMNREATRVTFSIGTSSLGSKHFMQEIERFSLRAFADYPKFFYKSLSVNCAYLVKNNLPLLALK